MRAHSKAFCSFTASNLCTLSQQACVLFDLFIAVLCRVAAHSFMCLSLVSSRGCKDEVTEKGILEKGVFAPCQLFLYCISLLSGGRVLKMHNWISMITVPSPLSLPSLCFLFCGCFKYARFAQPLHQPPPQLPW